MKMIKKKKHLLGVESTDDLTVFKVDGKGWLNIPTLPNREYLITYDVYTGTGRDEDKAVVVAKNAEEAVAILFEGKNYPLLIDIKRI